MDDFDKERNYRKKTKFEEPYGERKNKQNDVTDFDQK